MDWAILVLLGLFTLGGLWRGFIKSFIPLVGLVVGVFLAGRYYAGLAEGLFRSEASIARVGAFVLILLAVVAVAWVVASLLHRLFSLLMLGWVNRLAGAIFGLAFGGLILGAVLAALANYPVLGLEATIRDSALAAFLVERFPLVLSLLPEEFAPLRGFFR